VIVLYLCYYVLEPTISCKKLKFDKRERRNVKKNFFQCGGNASIRIRSRTEINYGSETLMSPGYLRKYKMLYNYRFNIYRVSTVTAVIGTQPNYVRVIQHYINYAVLIRWNCQHKILSVVIDKIENIYTAINLCPSM
jgi:hypothetical protein